MAIESDIVPPGTGYIDALDSSNPDGAVSEVREMDNHLRGIKNVILRTFANITGAVTATHGELNTLAGVVAGTVSASKAIVVSAGKAITGLVLTNCTANTQTSGDNSTNVATTAYVDAKLVMLDTPLSHTPGTGWATISDSTLASAGAIAAIVQVEHRGSVSSGIIIQTLGLRRTGSAHSIYGSGALLEEDLTAGTISSIYRGAQGTVKLDANQDFDAYCNQTGGSTTSRNVEILGYYV